MDRRNDLRTNPPALTRRTFPAHINPSAVFASALITITGIRDHHRMEHLITIPGMRTLALLGRRFTSPQCFYPTISGGLTAAVRTRFQSIPSTKAINCAGFICTRRPAELLAPGSSASVTTCGLKLVRPPSAKLPRRPLKTVGDRFDHMEGSSSRTRRRHRSSHRLTAQQPIADRRPTPPDGISLPLTISPNFAPQIANPPIEALCRV
ncbi:hypothetical protein SAMN05216525_1772 [Bradyrhizobium sp. Gha]|nr:hypothetical protein SAMN05216525_1772 [Bradyrhizobium sp. Gha]